MGFVEYSATLISQGPKKTFAARCIREIRDWAKIVLTEADRGATVRVYQVQEVLTTVFDKNYPCQHCGIPIPFGYDAEHKCPPYRAHDAPAPAKRCPTCGSPDPGLMPYTAGHTGRNPAPECRDPWHEQPRIQNREDACPDCKSTVRSHYNAVPVEDYMMPCRHPWHSRVNPNKHSPLCAALDGKPCDCARDGMIRVQAPAWMRDHGPTCNAILTGNPEACNCPASHSPDWKPGLEAHP